MRQRASQGDGGEGYDNGVAMAEGAHWAVMGSG